MNQEIAVQRRRRAFTELKTYPHLHAEVFLPDRLSVEVVAVNPARSERNVKIAAISQRRVRGETAVLAVIAFVRGGDLGHSLPQSLAGLLVQAHHDELLLGASALSSARAATPLPTASTLGRTLGRILWLLGRGRGLTDFARRHGRGQEDSVAPDHWRRETSARNRDLPLDIFSVAEFDRRGAFRHAVEERASPLRPMGGIGTGGTDDQNNRRQRDQGQQAAGDGQSFRHYHQPPAKIPGSAGILACLPWSGGYCRGAGRQGCLRSQEDSHCFRASQCDMNNSGENIRRSGPLRRGLRYRLLCRSYCAAG